jgi:hypothetical protein
MSKDKVLPTEAQEPQTAPVKGQPKRADLDLAEGEVVLAERKDGNTLIVVTSHGRKIVL